MFQWSCSLSASSAQDHVFNKYSAWTVLWCYDENHLKRRRKNPFSWTVGSLPVWWFCQLHLCSSTEGFGAAYKMLFSQAGGIFLSEATNSYDSSDGERAFTTMEDENGLTNRLDTIPFGSYSSKSFQFLAARTDLDDSETRFWLGKVFMRTRSSAALKAFVTVHRFGAKNRLCYLKRVLCTKFVFFEPWAAWRRLDIHGQSYHRI